MRKRILFVDDDVDWHFLVNGSLRDAGYDVLIANDAGEALRHVDENKLDLIVLDVDLGGGEEGIELANFLQTGNPPVPMIVYSAEPVQDPRLRNGSGARFHLQKGNMEELLKTVQTMLGPNDGGSDR